MSVERTPIDLGFAQARVPAGTHVCQIYDDAGERSDALLRFLSRGLRNGEAAACFSENISEDELEAWFAKDGLSLAEEKAVGRFTLSGAKAVYFEEGRFDPDRMLALLTKFHDDAVAAGRPAGRAPGSSER